MCHALVIRNRIGLPNHAVTGITRIDKSPSYITHIDYRYNVLAGTNQKTLSGLNQSNKTSKAGRITWPINPRWTDNYNWRVSILDQVSDQLLARDLCAAIWVVLCMEWMILGNNTM